MADFKTHIATSTVVGIGYGAIGYWGLGFEAPACLLASGLCGVCGMLPDIDSDSGVPLRESIAFGAAVVPMLMVDRFERMGLPIESIVLLGAAIYLFIRFVVAWLIKRYTVHRGMWHSVPAAVTVGFAAFFICSGPYVEVRIFKAGAVFLGYLTHLVLDEVWAIEWTALGFRFKRSFGTALKLWGDNLWGNVSVYAKLAALMLVAVGDPLLMEHLGFHDTKVHRTARTLFDDVLRQGGVWLENGGTVRR